jgi:hypothetical protein
MTAEEWGNKLNAKLAQIESGAALFPSAGSLIAAMQERIFERGEDVTGKTFNYNTTNEMWVADNVGPKGGSNLGKTGKKIKTTYYSSYNDFRGAMSRQTGTMNFRLNNELQSDFLASQSNVTGLEVELKLRNEINVKKRSGLEERLNAKIFSPSDSEVELFRERLIQNTNKILKA